MSVQEKNAYDQDPLFFSPGHLMWNCHSRSVGMSIYGDDHYILDIGCCSGNFDHLWGSNQDLKFNCNNVSICLTSVYHDLRLHGKGMISFASQNDLELEPNLSLPPFISEPGKLYKLFEETRLSEELADELRAKLSESFGEDFEEN
ncbi:hypothetical protein GQR58_012981 [Nymphon striatum]|nr:hypothetical protein GQR58_012981 [Nymphon striatum]